MKKIFTLTLIFIVAISNMIAWAAPGDAVLGREADGSDTMYYRGSFAIGDTLYLFNTDSISTWHVGETDVVSYSLQHQDKAEEADAYWSYWPFTANNRIYALVFITRYGEKTEFLRTALCEVELTREGDEPVAKLTEKHAVNWDGMISYNDQDSSAIEPQLCVGVGGWCCMMIYDDVSSMQLKLLNLDTGEITTADGLSDLCSIVPYKDETVLVQQFTYNEGDNIRFAVYDPKAGSSREIAQIKSENASTLAGLAYDPGSDKLYCIKGGEIHCVNLEKGEIEPAIADAPMDYYSDSGACVLQGKYYCHASSGAFVRNLDVSQRNETRIRVYDSSYNDAVQKAAAVLPNAHGEISVAVDRDDGVGSRLIESMMNQDDSVDVYIMGYSDDAFNAVYNRGYMMPLDGSEKLLNQIKRMYPAIQASLSRDGSPVAIPVSCDASTLAVNEKALERLGLKLEDVPRNWSDMLDFINQLPDRIKPEHKLNLFYEDQTFEEARRVLFSQMFQDYENYADHADPVAGYDTELMRGLMAKLESIDFTRFGCKHETTDDGDSTNEPEGDSVEEDDSLSIFETFTGCSFGNFYSEYTPILLSMDGATPAHLVLNMNVAFINPYTRHPKEALLFMEQLVDAMNRNTAYCVDPSLNEPVRDSNYEEAMEDYNVLRESLKKDYADCDSAEKQQLEAQMRELEQEIADYEKTSWDISQANIDWYRSNDKSIVLQGVEWLYSTSGDGEARTLIDQYHAGQIDAGTMLKGIDQKVRMMRIEGN